MARENPWATLAAASPSKLTARRVSERLQHDFFWACNSEGRYTFLAAFDSDVGDWDRLPQLRGISVSYYRNDHQLQLVLNDRSDWEIFVVLCQDIIQASDHAVTSSDLMESIVARLVRWQHLLSRGPRRILDEHEIRGLIGELLFIHDQVLPRFGGRAIEYWQGPDRLPQDFVIGKYLFEVKTHLVGDAPKVSIASPAQLWSGGTPLFLAVISLAHCARNAPAAVTLPGLVEALTTQLTGQPQLEVFEARLADFGYVPFPEYSELAYCPGPVSWYEVIEGFPRIDFDALVDGVDNVRYAIRIDACERFRSEPDWARIKEQAA
jgi:hypothetical protein